MVYQAYELKARLKHLTLSGQNEDGELEFIGTDKQWDLVENQIDQHENPVCEKCGGDGWYEELGDGNNFEVDVIGHKKCPDCNSDND